MTRSYTPGALSVSAFTHLVDETPNYICISRRPIYTCPRLQHSTMNKPVDVPMVCMPRFLPSAQQLVKRAIEGELLAELITLPATTYQRIFVPVKCSGNEVPYSPSSYRTVPRDY